MALNIDKTRCFEIPKGTYVNKETGEEIKIDGGYYFSKDTNYSRGEPSEDPSILFDWLQANYLIRRHHPSKNS